MRARPNMLIRSVWTRLKRALDQARVYLNRQNITTFVAAKHSDNASALALICQAFIIALGRPAGAQFPQRHAASLLTGKRQSSDCSQCLFQAPFFGGGDFPNQKNLQFPPQTAAKFCALSLFFQPGQRITNISWKLSFNGQQTQEIIRD